MVFATVGSAEPFDRLLKALQRVSANEDVVAQSGPTSVRLAGVQMVAFMPFDVLVDHVRSARAVVTHAGVGSVLMALGEGCRPVIVPRLRSLGEAVDDHQLEFARRLKTTGLAIVVEDVADLPSAVEAAAAETRATAPARSIAPLVVELRHELAAAVARQRPLTPSSGP
jgi:UDP-N-acetylglucosamine transferase subunit ALG13